MRNYMNVMNELISRTSANAGYQNHSFVYYPDVRLAVETSGNKPLKTVVLFGIRIEFASLDTVQKVLRKYALVAGTGHTCEIASLAGMADTDRYNDGIESGRIYAFAPLSKRGLIVVADNIHALYDKITELPLRELAEQFERVIVTPEMLASANTGFSHQDACEFLAQHSLTHKPLSLLATRAQEMLPKDPSLREMYYALMTWIFTTNPEAITIDF